MDTKERHIRENEGREEREERLRNEAPNADLVENSLKANGRNRKRSDTSKVNRLWLWLGVIVLIFILLYWLFAIGTFEDIIGFFNG